MQEYKREKTSLEGQLIDLKKRSTHHDDHLRTIDAWFGQVRAISSLLLQRMTADSLPFSYLMKLNFWLVISKMALSSRPFPQVFYLPTTVALKSILNHDLVLLSQRSKISFQRLNMVDQKYRSYKSEYPNF